MFTLKAVENLQALAPNDEWLIRGLWPNEGVGIIAAEPKCGKTWLAMEMAICVASGERCLGEFPVENTGPVLFFNAEDSETIQSSRLASIMRAKGLNYRDVSNLKIISGERLRLDVQEDISSLRRLVTQVRPKLLILDPFVRLHRINENSSAEVAELLSSLRDIQKTFGTAVILVHHLKKSGGKNARGGNKMRGSGEFFAFGESYIIMSKDRSGNVVMDVEMRASPGMAGVPLELINVNNGTHLQEVSPIP